MYPVSQAFQQIIAGAARNFSFKVQIRNQEFTGAHISEMVLDETVNPDDTFALGSVAAAKFELTLLDVSGIILENAPVSPWLGLQVNGTVEWVPLGVFTVDKIDVKNGKTKIICYDNMLRLEKPYFSDLSYPNTLRNVAQEIAVKAGVTLATTLPTTQVGEIAGYTLREALGFVASFMGGFARFNRAGELEIGTYQESGVDIPANSVIDLTAAENQFTIGRLQCRVGDSEDGPVVLTAGTSGNEIYFENPIMTQDRLNAILANLSQLDYMPLTANWQGNPALMPGDIVSIADRNRSYTTGIMEQQLRYTGGLRGTLVAKGKTETAQEFSYSGSMSRKMDRYSVEQANIKLALIDKASIGDLLAANAAIDNLYATKATVVDLTVAVGRIDMLETTRATIEQLNAVEADIAFLYSSKAEIDDLTAATAQIDQLTAGVANINTVLAKDVFAELAEFGQIRAGSSIIAEGAIGSAQVSDLSASKLTAGIADLSLVTIQGAGGRFRIENNLLQVFDGTVDLYERVAMGDINQDGSAYGLRIRGADGNTVLLDENGLTDQGFTDGYNKLPNNSLNPIKLDIGAVVTRINEGSTTIESSKIYMDNQTLDVAFSSIVDTVSGQGQTISQQGSQIIALADAIQLKVDMQTYVNGMDGVQSQLSTQSGSISVLQNEIVTKVTQTEINNAVNPLDVRITSAESTITQQADQIALRVEKDGVVSAINLSPEDVRIEGNRVQITGETNFASGYDPSQKATPDDVATAQYAAQAHAEQKAQEAQDAAVALSAIIAEAEAAAAQAAAEQAAQGLVSGETQARLDQAQANLQAAQAYADQAASAAQTAAQSFAELKAQEAQTAAVAVAEAKASLAQLTAQAYADGIVSAEEQARIHEAIANLNAAKAHADQKAQEAEQAAKKHTQSRGQNLVTNGTGLLGDNTNFSGFQFDGSEAFGANGSFKRTGAATLFSDESMPVNPELRYRLSAYFKVIYYGGWRQYFGLNCKDVDGHNIQSTHHMHFPDTITTLAQDLKPGDTYVYLTDATGWKNAQGSNTHQRRISFWNYKNSFGFDYGEGTYSRWQSAANTWEDGAVDYASNRVQLRVPWNYPNPADPEGIWRSGHVVSNGNAGGSYKYIAGSGVTGEEWEERTGYIQGVDYSGTNVGSKFPPGTAAVTILFLVNYQGGSTDSTLYVSNIQFGLDLETPEGAQAKANIAEQAAKTHAEQKAAEAQAAAEAVAEAKAALAQATAEAYADGIVSVEEAARIQQAIANLNEAKGYADQKAAEAQAAAQSHAEQKASEAQAAAEAYALAQAEVKAAEAQAAAEIAAQGMVSAETQARIDQAQQNLTEAKTYADSAAAEAEAAAKAYAELKAQEAEDNSQSYTNWAIDQFGYTLGDMAWSNLVELAQLGTTIIQGGFLRTDLIQAGSIAAEKLAVNDLSAISGWFSNLSAGAVGGARLELGQSGGPHLNMFDSGNKLRVSLLQDKLTFRDTLARHGGSIYSFREDPTGYNLPSIAVHSDSFTMIMASPHYVPGSLDPSPGKTYAYISLAHLSNEVGVNIGVWDIFGQGNGRILLRPNSITLEGDTHGLVARIPATGFAQYWKRAGVLYGGLYLTTENTELVALNGNNLRLMVASDEGRGNPALTLYSDRSARFFSDIIVDGRMFGTSIVGSDQLRVATGSTSGTINVNTSINIAMHRRTFAQNFYSATHHVYLVGNGNNVADYIARFRLHNTGTANSAYALRWEYMASTNPLVTLLLIDTVTGEIVNATMDGGGMEYLVNEYRHSYQEMIAENEYLLLLEPSIEELAAVLAEVQDLNLGGDEDITEMLYHNDQVGVDAATLIQHLCYRGGRLQAKSIN